MKSRFNLFAALVLMGSSCGVYAQNVNMTNCTSTTSNPLLTSTSTTAVTIDPNDGSVAVNCAVQQGTPVQINNFVSTSPVIVNNSITLNWTTTGSGTITCSPVAGTGGSTGWTGLTLGTSGPANVTAPSSAQTVTFQLTCTNGTSSDTKTAQTVVQPQGTPGCTGASGSLTMQSSPTSFSTLFGSAFPGNGGTSRIIDVQRGQYIALQFTTPASGLLPSGTFQTADTVGSGEGNGRMSISVCPGDFRTDGVTLANECLGFIQPFPLIGWRSTPGPKSCNLSPSTTYYLNITFGADSAPSGNNLFCANSTCRRTIQTSQ